MTMACLFVTLALGLATLASAAAASAPLAFVHVNVVPLATEGVLADQTVVIVDGRISAVGRQARIPADGTVIHAGPHDRTRTSRSGAVRHRDARRPRRPGPE